MEKENLHAGHRERMLNKFSSNPDALLDHELLETLLFYAIPRIDTNPLAHKILRTFGSVEKVLNATSEELMAIDGVGEKTANLIAIVGKIHQTANKNKKEKTRLSSFYDVQQAVKRFFDSIDYETFVVLMVDKSHYLLNELEFSDGKQFEVTADIPELSKALAIHKPCFVILAHNHNSGNTTPSDKDDIATKKINLLCEVHGIALIDHIIYSKDKFYSYHQSGRMEYIKGEDDINNLLIKPKENENE